jgi:Flp pilus assembly protein TadD
MTDCPPTPMDVQALWHTGLVFHASNRRAEAETLYRQILQHNPEHAGALGMLGVILADGSDDVAAEAVILRHLALCPDDGASLLMLGQLRARQGDDEAAVAALRRAARGLSHLAPIHYDLGMALHRLGRLNEALAALDRAVVLDPAYSLAHGNRGLVLFDLQRFDEAVDAQLAALTRIAPEEVEVRAWTLHNLAQAGRRAGRFAAVVAAARAELEAGHTDSETVEQLALILDQAALPQEARALRNDLARRTGAKRSGQSSDAAATVLVLGAVGAGHVPTRYLLDLQRFAALSVILLSPDQADAPLGAVDSETLRQADVVFSTLADVDHDCGQFAAAAALCASLDKPVVNPPVSILKTGRDSAAELFQDIPGMVTPVVRRATPGALADLSIDNPLLVRPVGDHGGENLVLLRNDADKHAYLAAGPDEQLLLTPFHNFRSPDGHWRKYRLIFIDRRVYPYHLAIGDDWLLHYWRAETLRSDWKKAEEERFLADWQGVFGAQAAQAVEAAAHRLDLDYGGMDCALTRDGRVLLFEANACILLHLDEPAGAFPYKHRHVPRIRDAFTRLVCERAGRRTT